MLQFKYQLIVLHYRNSGSFSINL